MLITHGAVYLFISINIIIGVGGIINLLLMINDVSFLQISFFLALLRGFQCQLSFLFCFI